MDPSSSSRAITDAWASSVESTGNEIGVTLLVQGVPVSGILTPRARFDQHAEKSFALVALAGGKFPAGQTAPEITPGEQQLAANAWYEETGYSPPGEGEAPMVAHVELICLRNAVIMSGLPGYWPRFAYLLIEAADVNAIAVGAVESQGE